jgi:phospholipid transport system substrate-binding protein
MLNRRSLLTLLAATALSTRARADADHPAVVFVRKVAKELLAAHRQGTTPAFLRVIQRYADLPDISAYSLGKYSASLQKVQKPRFHRAVATYMARVLAMGSRDYTVAKYEIGQATVDKNKDVIVSSKVYLVTGQAYSVGWHLVSRGGRYKVRDIRVIIWLIPQQKSEFVSFLNKYDGDINRLILALLG